MAKNCYPLKIMSKLSKFIDKITSKINEGLGKIADKVVGKKDKLTTDGGKESWADVGSDTPTTDLEKNLIENAPDKGITGLLGIEAETPLGKDLQEVEKAIIENHKNNAEYMGLINYEKGETANTEQGGIIDTTGQNEDMPIGENYNMEAYKQLRDEAWAREDAIRKETQAREDTAWQRSVEDAQKAGINVNLMNMQPAASGGGITSATGIDTSAGELELDKYLTELEGILDRELKADEGTKDRISDLISSIIFAGAMLMK